MSKIKPNKRYPPQFMGMVIRWIKKDSVSYNKAKRKYGIVCGQIQKLERIYMNKGQMAYRSNEIDRYLVRLCR